MAMVPGHEYNIMVQVTGECVSHHNCLSICLLGEDCGQRHSQNLQRTLVISGKDRQTAFFCMKSLVGCLFALNSPLQSASIARAVQSHRRFLLFANSCYVGNR